MKTTLFEVFLMTAYLAILVCAVTGTSTWSYQVYKEQTRLDLQMECK